MASNVALISNRFLQFADEARGSSALCTHLSPDIASDQELLELLLHAPPMQRRANLLFAAAHDLLLAGVVHPVAQYYASIVESAIPPDKAAFDLFRDLCLSQRERLRETIATRQTQTNEVRRSAAFLPVFQCLCHEAPTALVEVGTSAGLNLLVDRYRYQYSSGPWTGAADSRVSIHCEVRGISLPVLPSLGDIAYRVGIDTHPLDASSVDDVRWLKACVWPEQTDRIEMLQSAVDIAREERPRIVEGNALDVLADVLSGIPEDLTICVFNSATLFYFSPEDCDVFLSLLSAFGDRELHWLSLEGGALHRFEAKLPFDRLFVPRCDDRPTDIFGLVGYARWRNHRREDYLLGRADMHGRWVEWATSVPWY